MSIIFYFFSKKTMWTTEGWLQLRMNWVERWLELASYQFSEEKTVTLNWLGTPPQSQFFDCLIDQIKEKKF